MKLVRSRDGSTIHTPDCTVSGERSQWGWPDDKTPSEVLRAALEVGLRLCRRCNPLEGTGAVVVARMGITTPDGYTEVRP